MKKKKIKPSARAGAPKGAARPAQQGAADAAVQPKAMNKAMPQNAGGAASKTGKPVQNTKKAAKKPLFGKPLFGKSAAKKKAAGNKMTQTNTPVQPKPKVASELHKPTQPVQPAQPISGEQRKAYNKAVRNRSQKSRKRGSRGGNYIFYYLLIGILLVLIFVILANTVLFKCSSFEVEGTERYTAEQIIEKSGLKTGDSLLSIDETAAERAIVEALPYIDTADVSKSFPTKIKISVTEAERWYQVEHEGSSYIVSRLGKIIEQGSDAKLPKIIGFEAAEPYVGGTLTSSVEAKTTLASEVLSAAENAGLKKITSIDITDRFEITVLVDGRITLQLGISTELDNKMHIAYELIENEISATESVTVNITNTEKVYVRDNNVIDNNTSVPGIVDDDTVETGEATAEAGTAEA